MIELSNISLPLDAGLPENENLILKAAAKALDISDEQIASVRLLKRSVDARKKQNVHFVASLGVRLVCESDEPRVSENASHSQVKLHTPYEPLPIPSLGDAFAKAQHPRPIVVGTGPAGLFAALYLAKAGLRPLVIERGQAVEQRLVDVEAFNKGADLDPNSNIQFGEGGAGTFSDGKLTTNTKSPYAAHVLRWFAEAGAPEEILWQAKPHIGTDHLVEIVRTIRQQITDLGGEVRFNTQLTGLHFKGEMESIQTTHTKTGETQTIEAKHLILATGHSARDTFAMLHDNHIHLEQKPFSVGVRIEHPQKLINEAQYGSAATHPALGAADYKLAVHLGSGRSVYTFCMCPGGVVVCAASEPQTVVVNGMSRFARDAENANSAVLVSVDPKDFGSDHPLAGIEFQRKIEQDAYKIAAAAGGTPYQAPSQSLGDFLGKTSEGARSAQQVKTAGAQASYARGVVYCDLKGCLPAFVAEALAEAFPLFDRKLKGFAHKNAVLTGVETRSSSPVRISRDKTFQACLAPDQQQAQGLYPCGEGAGYAGGIMSAATDGLRTAEALVSNISSTLSV